MIKQRLIDNRDQLKRNLAKYEDKKESIYQNNIHNILSNKDIFGEIIDIDEVIKELDVNDYMLENYKDVVNNCIKKIDEVINSKG